MTENEGILPLEVVEKIKSAAAERQANYRNRKDRAKAKLKTEKEVRDATPEAFWTRNRDVSNQARIAELQERQERVFDLLHWMQAQVKGTYNADPNDETVYVGLEEGAANVAADVAAHGICEMEVILLGFWREPELLAELKLNEATQAFCRYGLITGIPGHKLHEWKTWLQRKNPTHLVDPKKCSCSGCTSGPQVAGGVLYESLLHL
jgi:hypothetical protein